MPFEIMDSLQVARYLHLDARDIDKMASRGKIPCQKRKDGYVFRKIEIDHWMESQLHDLPLERLAQIEHGVRQHHGIGADEIIIHKMIPTGGVNVEMTSRTRASILRDLVAMAESLGLVYSRQTLYSDIDEREQMQSTALLKDIALPHPRHHSPYDIAESFVVVARVGRGIPFGAMDGSLTRLFFLICCKDDRTHLHVLARLTRILQDRQTVQVLLDAADSEEFMTELTSAEWLAMKDTV